MTVGSVAIHQPNLFPRLKVLQKLTHADAWVVFDDVQFVSREWQSRTRLRYAGDPSREFWLSLPARRPAGQATLIRDVTIVEHSRALARLHRAIAYAYKSAPYWGAVEGVLEQLPVTDQLVDLAVATTDALLSAAGVEVATSRSSTLTAPGKRVTKLIGVCRAIGAQEYLSGSGGASYTDTADFERAGIDVRFQAWEPPATAPPLPWRNISALDYLARHGSGALRDHLHTRTATRA